MQLVLLAAFGAVGEPLAPCIYDGPLSGLLKKKYSWYVIW